MPTAVRKRMPVGGGGKVNSRNPTSGPKKKKASPVAKKRQALPAAASRSERASHSSSRSRPAANSNKRKMAMTTPNNSNEAVAAAKREYDIMERYSRGRLDPNAKGIDWTDSSSSSGDSEEEIVAMSYARKKKIAASRRARCAADARRRGKKPPPPPLAAASGRRAQPKRLGGAKRKAAAAGVGGIIPSSSSSGSSSSAAGTATRFSSRPTGKTYACPTSTGGRPTSRALAGRAKDPTVVQGRNKFFQASTYRPSTPLGDTKAKVDPFAFPSPDRPAKRARKNSPEGRGNKIKASSPFCRTKISKSKAKAKAKCTVTNLGYVAPNCTHISIFKPSRTAEPDIHSFPPPRKPKLAPRLYAQNTKAPLAAEARKLAAAAAAAAADGKGPLESAFAAAAVGAAAKAGAEAVKAGEDAAINESGKPRFVAPFMLQAPNKDQGPPPQRVQNQLHKWLVAGEFDLVWDRIWSHPAELHVMDKRAMTPLDYGVTFDVPSELLDAILQAQRPLKSDAYTIVHPLVTKGGRMSTNIVKTPRTDPDTLQSYIYNDSGQLAIHRGFINNCAIRVQRMLLKYNPELVVCETLTHGLVEKIKREHKAKKHNNTTLMFWSTSIAKAFAKKNDPNFWSPQGASGPRCTEAHARNANAVVSNLFDCAWNSSLERAVMGRKLFADEKLDTIDKYINEEKVEEAERIAITLMWARFSLLLQTTYETFYDGNSKWGGVKSTKKKASAARAAAASTPEPMKTRSKQKATGELEAPAPPAPSYSFTSTTAPPRPDFTYNPKAVDETLESPKYPALISALLNHNLALEILQFILRIFPEQAKMKDPATGLYPIHMVAKGMCPPLRWGWNLPTVDTNYQVEGESPEESRVRRERERSTALIPLLIKVWPEGVKARDPSGRLPVHHALEAGHRYHNGGEVSASSRCSTYERDVANGCYNTGLSELLDASPDAHTKPDPETGLYPFMLAASSPGREVADLNTVYELLLLSPDSVQSGIFQKERRYDMRRKI